MTPTLHSKQSAPLTDAIVVAVAQLVDDAQSDARRDPSHWDIQSAIQRCELTLGDPRGQGQTVGKSKRIRGILSWAMEHYPEGGETFVAYLISVIRGHGGFRPTSSNYVGAEAIRNAADAFSTEGYHLTEDGELRPLLLDNLTGVELTEALNGYVRRTKRGASDAALLAGTGKDLLEATAAHILKERYGDVSTNSNFPTLLGQVFIELGLATSQNPEQFGESPTRQLEAQMYQAACAVNRLRNKEGTGHGRAWPPSVTDTEAKLATEVMGAIAEWLLQVHKDKK